VGPELLDFLASLGLQDMFKGKTPMDQSNDQAPCRRPVGDPRSWIGSGRQQR
jgi:hypothetical protein